MLFLVCWILGGSALAIWYAFSQAAAGAYRDATQFVFAFASLSGINAAAGFILGVYLFKLTFLQVGQKWILIEKEKVQQ